VAAAFFAAAERFPLFAAALPFFAIIPLNYGTHGQTYQV
jgi:hypothetical protein